MKEKILFVDDEPKVLDAYRRQLRNQFTLDIADSGERGLDMIRANGKYSVIVSDMQMPQMDGVQFLQQAQKISPDSVRIMLTGNADQKTAIKAVNDGCVYRFLTKPCSTELLALTLENGLQHYQLIRSEKELLEKTLMGCISVLTEILSLSNSGLVGRGERIRKLARVFMKSPSSREMGYPWKLETAALLLEIGQVAVPETVIKNLEDGVPLSDKEQGLVDSIPQIGFELLDRIPRLEGVARMVKYHNKNYDGSGLPLDNKSGERIPEGARILRILSDLVDLEDKGIGRSEALQRMQSRKNCYDPVLLEEVQLCFRHSGEDPAAVGMTSVEVELSDVSEGDILASDFLTNEGVLILPAGTEVTNVLLKRLNNFTEILEFNGPIVVLRSSQPANVE